MDFNNAAKLHFSNNNDIKNKPPKNIIPLAAFC